ncbi:protein ITPRID2 isoform X2 [Hyperolius riggenbachi]|uniref:protein ITPRID2 isoform X2 n=1 Tax=Hyperolius riggenbachi TaxID=752182 RepID=UPI0035A3BED5
MVLDQSQRLAETGTVQHEKIAIWLKDCRTPLGASLDEQTNPTGSPKGMILKNGSSFEDDLSLGAEANHLHQKVLPMERPFNELLAKDRRLQFHQKGRSMNSTGSGKSSTTVSSVSELLDLYEEDPEEILYNLGFGRDEPDIASKIPSRFFNGSSLASGIDIKVFLNAQMQRLEVENPNYALTSRFRQIKVLTDVANAFSSLYSQVSGTPIQRIGNSKSLTTSTSVDQPSKPAPLTRAPSQTAARLMETLSKLNLVGNRTSVDASSFLSPVEGAPSPKSEEEANKNDQKTQKPFKKTSSPLATVKEETSTTSTDLIGHNVVTIPKENGIELDLHESNNITQNETSMNSDECISGHTVDSISKDLSVSVDQEHESFIPEKDPATSTPEKELFAQNPSIKSLTMQTKESFELEELQSTEEEPPQVPPTSQLASDKKSKDNLLRTASQHSDSSGFAEDTSGDLTNNLPAQDSLQTMGSSADSCDSETTVMSIGEDMRTPRGFDQQESIDLDLDDEFLTPVDLGRKAFFDDKDIKEHLLNLSSQSSTQNEDHKSSMTITPVAETDQDTSEKHLLVQQECPADSELETQSEYEAVSYTTHHISETLDSFSDYGGYAGFRRTDSSSLDRVNVALQRAQKKVYGSSEAIAPRTGRSTITSKDLLKRRHKLSNSGYPLRRVQSLPTPVLSPVRVVSKVNIVLNSGKATVCSPPSFSYKYNPDEEGFLEQIGELDTTHKSTVFKPPVSDAREVQKSNQGHVVEEHIPRPQSCTMQAPSHRSHSSCSLHSLQYDWHDRPLCDHARAWSTHSVPNVSGAAYGSVMSPYSCPNQRFSCGSPQRSCSGCSLPMSCAPSTTEMQLRRVLHDIRSSLQNLSQHPVMRGADMSSIGGYNTQRSSILSLYENTFQELQIMRRSLNLFRTQMMDLELNMLRQQTMVYQHLTEDERYEADQLQGLRNSVRIELQELELQLDERLMTLEEQLRSFHISSPYQRQVAMGMYGGRGSTDSLVFTSPLNVIEPVTELIREQSHLKSELGLEDNRLESGADRCDSVLSQAASDSSSLCSSPIHKVRKGALNMSDTVDRPKAQTSPNKAVYRASVALTPSPPVRPGVSYGTPTDFPEEPGSFTLESTENPETEHVASLSEGGSRWSPEESRELQQVIKEIKESIVGDIRREIVSGLLAAVSSPMRSSDGKTDGRI